VASGELKKKAADENSRKIAEKMIARGYALERILTQWYFKRTIL
jgi:hypothetical protein